MINEIIYCSDTGVGRGSGIGSGNGYDNGCGYGSGDGNGISDGSGYGNGNGIGSGIGYGIGKGRGNDNYIIGESAIEGLLVIAKFQNENEKENGKIVLHKLNGIAPFGETVKLTAVGQK